MMININMCKRKYQLCNQEYIDSGKCCRERLLEANQEAYEVEMNRASKVAILNAWNRQKSGVRKNQKTVDNIARLKNDVDEQVICIISHVLGL